LVTLASFNSARIPEADLIAFARVKTGADRRAGPDIQFSRLNEKTWHRQE
jgi:hypothetical protein